MGQALSHIRKRRKKWPYNTSVPSPAEADHDPKHPEHSKTVTPKSTAAKASMPSDQHKTGASQTPENSRSTTSLLSSKSQVPSSKTQNQGNIYTKGTKYKPQHHNSTKGSVHSPATNSQTQLSGAQAQPNSAQSQQTNSPANGDHKGEAACLAAPTDSSATAANSKSENVPGVVLTPVMEHEPHEAGKDIASSVKANSVIGKEGENPRDETVPSATNTELQQSKTGIPEQRERVESLTASATTKVHKACGTDDADDSEGYLELLPRKSAMSAPKTQSPQNSDNSPEHSGQEKNPSTTSSVNTKDEACGADSTFDTEGNDKVETLLPVDERPL